MKSSKYVLDGQATSNGIIFRSNEEPILSYNTYYDEHGNIWTMSIPSFFNKSEGIVELMKGDKFPTKTLTFSIFISLIVLSIIIMLKGNANLSVALLIFSYSVFSLTHAIKFICLSKPQNGCWHDLAKYHSAKHMVTNAYKKYKRLPTFEEVKNSSRFSETCSSLTSINDLALYFFLSMMLFFFGNLNPIIYLIICVIYFLVMHEFVFKRGYLKFMEFIYTVPASEKEIKLAIVALENFIKKEECISNDDFQASMEDYFEKIAKEFSQYIPIEETKNILE